MGFVGFLYVVFVACTYLKISILFCCDNKNLSPVIIGLVLPTRLFKNDERMFHNCRILFFNEF